MDTGEPNVAARRDLERSKPGAGRPRVKDEDSEKDRPVKVDVVHAGEPEASEPEVSAPESGGEERPTQDGTHETHPGHEDDEHPKPVAHPGSHHHEEPCGCGCGSEVSCGAVVLERNRYFYSKVMTARDFTDEQAYFVSRHRLHNRLLHGWGIICGLEVHEHPKPECRTTRVVVEAGIAIDCCGREVVLEKSVVFDLSADPHAGAGHGARHPGSPAVLCIRYHEEKIEHVPVLYSEEGCEPGRREANRLREGAQLVLVDWSDLPAGCWGRRGGAPDECQDCGAGAGASGCLEPTCACGELIPLAVLDFDEELHEEITIDSSGRHQLPTPGEQLTHVAGINWTHGGEITLEELVDGMHGRLEVRFDRRIKEAVGEATGINARTFVAQFVNVQRDLEFLPGPERPGESEDGSPWLSPDDPCVAVFDIDPRYLNFRSGLAGSTVFVTLKCDFILDCNDNAVDGNHLKGILPSGDGIPGGVFESWFRVVADRGGHKEAAR